MEQEQAANTDDNELLLVPDPFLVDSCPFLGVRDDPGTPMGYPTPDNLCYAFEPALHVDLEKQREHCLSDCYSDCLYYQQQMADSADEVGRAPWTSGTLRRIVNGRTLAGTLMLLLILLAVLIWWPPPGTSMKERTVFGFSFSLNSPNVEGEPAEKAEQPVVTKESGAVEAVSAAKVEERVDEAKQPESIAEAGGAKQSSAPVRSSGQDATLNSPSVDGADPPLEESSSPPAPQEKIEEEPTAAPQPTAMVVAPIVEEKVQEDAAANDSAAPGNYSAGAESEAVPEIAVSDLPDDVQEDYSPAVDGGEDTREKSAFSPIAYGERESDDETLNVYEAPHSGSYIRIARPELFNLLGRNDTAEWIKIRTKSGIEGWVLASDTELGGWIESLPKIESE